MRRAACLVVLACLQCAGVQAAETLPELIARAKPSVLLIGTYAETDSPRFGFRGTGFAVASGNIAVTNAHVLPEIDESSIGMRQLVVQVPSGTGDNKWTIRMAK